ARRETRAHARPERSFAGIGDEQRFAFEDIDELVLQRMRMPECGYGSRLEDRQVDAEVPEPEEVPGGPLLPACHERGKRLRIAGRLLAEGRIDRGDGNRWICRVHDDSPDSGLDEPRPRQ